MNIEGKVNGASKWSLITELLSKLMTPIVNMVLARLLAPEAFGMVATITMITSFADIFTDAGFQKYLVQKDFENIQELDNNTNVAFWTNFSLSIFIWIFIFIFRHGLATTVGNSGLGNALALAACAIPLTSFSSIQMARFRRDLDFKTLFIAKLLGIFIPLFITVPLAFILKTYWALIIGNLFIQVANAIMLTVRSKWKPCFFYSFDLFKKMLDFSLWTLLEQLLGWANMNIGIFIVGRFLSDYYLGLYKTSMATANQVMAIIVNSFSPVILATLSRLKTDETEYKNMFYTFEERISVVIFPLGVGILVYRDLVTRILLGNQWLEASSFIGLWGLMRSLHIVFGIFSMEVFVSKGKPKFSVLSQVLELLVLLPTLLITAQKGYMILYFSRSMVVIWCIIVELILLRKVTDISPCMIFKQSLFYIFASVLMGTAGYIFISIYKGMVWQILSVLFCIIIYFGILLINKNTRKTVLSLSKMFVKE